MEKLVAQVRFEPAFTFQMARLRAAAGLAMILPLLMASATGAYAPSAMPLSRVTSIIDVPSRRVALGSWDREALERLSPSSDCGKPGRFAQPPQGSIEGVTFYQSGNHGLHNQAYHDFERPFSGMQRAASEYATCYVVYGNPVDAANLLDLLYGWAQAGAMEHIAPGQELWHGEQALMEIAWAGSSAAIALSLVSDAPGLDQERLAAVRAWLKRVAANEAADSEDLFSASPKAQSQLKGVMDSNHGYWRGLLCAAVGAATGDEELFQVGLRFYSRAIAQIADDGAFPLEMERHEYALHYQNFAIEPLVGIAELAEQRGVDLYSLRNSSGRTLHDAVNFLLAAMRDPQMLANYGLPPQDMAGFEPGALDLGWMEAYYGRFVTPGMRDFLAKPAFDWRLGGNAAVLWSKAQSSTPLSDSSETNAPRRESLKATRPIISLDASASPARARPPFQSLDCSDARQIRAFKDAIYSRLDPGGPWVESWPRCLCGSAADEAGANPTPRDIAKGFPGLPTYDEKDPAGSLWRIKTQYFQTYLIVSDAQASTLARCVAAAGPDVTPSAVPEP